MGANALQAAATVNDTPEFSVILTTHSRPEWLAEAIDSVLTQTIADFELVIVDDASDPPAHVPEDPRICLVRLDENVGVSAARNVGIDTSTGRAVTFLDDDDLFTRRRLEWARVGLQSAPLTVCWSHYMGEPVRNNRTLEGDVSDTVLDDTTPSFGVTAVRRDSIVRLDERWEAVEDIDWWLRAAQVLEVSTVREVGLSVRRHDARRWRNGARVRMAENLDLLDVHRAFFDTHGRAAAFRLKRAGLLALQTGDNRGARSALTRSLRRRPRASTAWHLARACRSSSRHQETAPDR